MAFEALFAAFCLPFLRVAMSKERAELAQRKAALTDSLTGIANRRAFFDLGGPLLEWAVADRRPAALLLFDLDRFKEVNDTAGHQAGDRVLKASATSLRRRCGRAICLAGSAARNSPGCWRMRPWPRRCTSPSGCAASSRRYALQVRGQRHRQRRRGDGQRSRPQLAGAAGDRRPRALPRQSRRAKSRRAGAAGPGRHQRRRNGAPDAGTGCRDCGSGGRLASPRGTGCVWPIARETAGRRCSPSEQRVH